MYQAGFDTKSPGQALVAALILYRIMHLEQGPELLSQGSS